MAKRRRIANRELSQMPAMTIAGNNTGALADPKHLTVAEVIAMGIGGEGGGGQPLDATLTALAALDTAAGLLEQTGADAFTKRALGVGASTSVPTRADADTRYAAASHAHAEGDVTGLTAALAGKQPLDAGLTSIAALGATMGLVEKTATDTYTERLIGVANATDILTRAGGDGRYATAGHSHAAVALDAHAAPTDIVTLNATASAHGLLPKLSGNAANYLNGAGAWTTPAGGAGGDLAMTKHLLSSNTTVTAGYGCVVPRYLELAAGITLEVGAGADLEIT